MEEARIETCCEHRIRSELRSLSASPKPDCWAQRGSEGSVSRVYVETEFHGANWVADPSFEKLKPDRLFRPSLNRIWGEMHAEAAAKDGQQEPAVWLGSGAHTPG